MRKRQKLSEETKRKISETMKKRVASGDFVPPSADPKVMEKLKERMKHNNPSKTETVRIINRLKHLGDNNPHWNGGVKKYDPSRNFSRARKFRQKVLDRDDWRCQHCGLQSIKGSRISLHHHHILSWKEYPELRFKLNNCITLCKECHQEVHSYLSSAGLITPIALGQNSVSLAC